MKKRHMQGFIFGAFSALFYSLMALFTKLAVDVNLESITFFRNIICFFLILIPVVKNKVSLKTNKLPLHLIRAFFGLLSLYCYFYAIKNLPLVNAVILACTSTIFIPFVVFFWFKEKIPPRRLLAVLIGFFGVALILKPDPTTFLDLGNAIGLLAGLFIAIATVGIRKLSKTEKSEVILFNFFIISTVFSFFPMIYAWMPIEGLMWAYIFLVGICGTLFQFCLTKAYTYAPPTRVSTVLYLSVVFGGLFEWIIWETIPDFWTLLGTVLIVAGGLLALFDKKQAIKMLEKD